LPVGDIYEPCSDISVKGADCPVYCGHVSFPFKD